MSKADADDKLDKAFVEGIRQGSLETVLRTLNAGADLECIDQYGYPGLPLRTAAFLGHKEIVLELLRRGANPNSSNSDGPGAPFRMAARGKRDEIISILRQHTSAIPEGVLPDLNLPPIIPELLGARQASETDQTRAKAALEAAVSIKHEEQKKPERSAVPSNSLLNVSEQGKAARTELGIESVVIGACYGVDTQVLEGDLLRLSQSDNDDSGKPSGKDKPSKKKFW